MTLKTPQEIVDNLNSYVIGQDEAKRTLQLPPHNHYKRVNAMLTGDTGAEVLSCKSLTSP